MAEKDCIFELPLLNRNIKVDKSLVIEANEIYNIKTNDTLQIDYFQQLCEFLFCRYFCTLNGYPLISPPKYIDTFWHIFLLETNFYERLCSKITNGSFVHHSILTSIDTPQQKHDRRLLYMKIYKRIFNKEFKSLCFKTVKAYEYDDEREVPDIDTASENEQYQCDEEDSEEDC